MKTVKKMFKKAESSNEDPLLALLNHRSTPRGKVHSPASMLMGRQLRTNIPCSFVTLAPKLTYMKDKKILMKQKEDTKSNYDKTATTKQGFRVNQSIRFKKMPNDKTWIKGKIVQKTNTPRSYIVENMGGATYNRN